MKIDIQLLSDTATLPQKMTPDAAGYDIYADNIDDIVIKPLGRALIPTGFAIAIPPQYEAQIRPRSGLAINSGITVLNSPGTIDADYRGEVKIILANLSDTDFIVKKGMRIAQMIVSRHENIDFEIVKSLNKTDRGSGGFGHT